MGLKAQGFWAASQAYRTASTDEDRHQARVALLNLAVEADDSVGRRAAALLRTEGLAIIRPAHPAGVQAL